MAVSKNKSTTGFVSDQDLTEQEFIDKYKDCITLSLEYLKARYRWLVLRPGDDRVKITNEMHDAYEKTEAYRNRLLLKPVNDGKIS